MSVSRSGSEGRRKQRALVVEPDRAAADGTLAVLEELGYVGYAARDGREALMSLSRPPALVLVDSARPIERTVDFLKSLRRMKELESVPVLGTYSGRRPAVDVIATLRENGVLGFLQRPFVSWQFEEAMAGGGGGSSSGDLSPVGSGSESSLPPFHSVTQPSMAPVGSASGTYPPSDPGARGPGSEVDGAVEFEGKQARCTVDSVSRMQIELRCRPPFPDVGNSIRVYLSFRQSIDGAARDLPIRLLGEVMALEPSGASCRVRVRIRIANPPSHLDALIGHLSHFS